MAPQTTSTCVYQIIDEEDGFTQGIFTDLEAAKVAALKLCADRKWDNAQINRILLNQVGPYSEEMDCVWTVREGCETPTP
jgi:hypothetical protein